MCRSEGVLEGPSKMLRAAMVKPCPAELEAAPLGSWAEGQRELGIVLGDSERRKKSDFEEQSILSLVHREMFATGRQSGGVCLVTLPQWPLQT